MPRVEWDKTGERLFETGLDRGVLYPMKDDGTYDKGVAWNGLLSFNESPEGGEPTPLRADNIVYVNLMSEEEFGGSLSAYTYPEEFEECDGSKELVDGVTAGQQERKPFGFSYRTLIGNDVKKTGYGYKIHLVYGALASPSEKEHATVNDTPEAEEFSWDIKTTPVMINREGFKPTAHLVINSTKLAPQTLAALEELLYGSETGDPTLPTPEEVAELVGNPA